MPNISSRYEEILAVVVEQIRQSIGEDWIQPIAIDSTSRFTDDLEIESIEFMKITDALQARFSNELDFVGWLSSKTIHELIGLSVGDLTDFIVGSLYGAA
jgi:acyl carrier protein